jgi:DNA-binding CsgD family transcriptional regulator/PAS domain-containing protein
VIVAPSLDPEFVRSYRERYFALDPAQLLPESAPVGRLATPPRPVAQLARSEMRFLQEWLEPQRLLPMPALAGVVNRDESLGTSVLRVFGSESAGRPSPGQRRLGSRLMPHLRRAVRMHHRVAEAENERRALASAFDRIPIGLILVDGRHHVRATNRAAERILAGRAGLELNRDGLNAVDSAQQTESLQRLLAEAIAARHPAEDEAPAQGLLLGCAGRRALQVVVTRIDPPDGGSQPTHAAVFVCDSEQELAERPELLRSLFDLTPAEAALARRLASGCSLERSARELGIAIGTARQRLQQIFAKTQTNRQSELVRLLLTGPPQLLADD